MQRHLRVSQHHQQLLFLPPRLLDPLVQQIIPRSLTEHSVELLPQSLRFFRPRIPLIPPQFPVVRPERLPELRQQLAVLWQIRTQLLVVPSFMHPAQRPLLGHPFELRGVVAHQRLHHRDPFLRPVSRQSSRFQDPLPLLRSRARQMLLQQRPKRRFVNGAFALGGRRDRPQRPHPLLRQPGAGQIRKRLLIQPKRARLPGPEHIPHRQTLLGGGGSVGAVERIAQGVAGLVFALDGRASLIQLLPGSAGQARVGDRLRLAVQPIEVLCQQPRDLLRRDRQPGVVEQGVEVWLTHPARVDEPEGETADAGSKLAVIAGGQLGTETAMQRGRIVNRLAEADRLHAQLDLLNDDVLVAFELGIGREAGRIEVQDLGAVDGQAVELGSLLTSGGLVALGLGGQVGGGAGSVALALSFGACGAGKSRLCLLALEAVDLVFEALVLLLERLDLGVEELDEVKQAEDGKTSGLVGNEIEIQIEVQIGHRAISESGRRAGTKSGAEGPG